jgi:sn-glycerol 3-phosphate transport system substrate-binding protein
MGGALGEWVTDLANQFNASQKEYKVVPTFKGSYGESMTAAIAAFRAGNAPDILQVFEVGTATMMYSKGAIKPVAEVMKLAGVNFDPKAYVPAVAGYYTAPNGQMLSFPFNSSTTVFYYNKDAFKAAGLDPNKPPKTWPEVALAAGKLKASGHKCPFTTSWISWTQLENFSAWHNVLFATLNNGFGGLGTRLQVNSPLHVRHFENLAAMAKNGQFVYKGRDNAADATMVSGECAMGTFSAGLLGNLKRNAKFEFGVSTLPYYPDVPGAPQNTVIGGASLWVMSGKKPRSTRAWPSSWPSVATRSAGRQPPAHRLPAGDHGRLRADRKERLLQEEPRHRRGREQMIRKTTDKSRGIRLGNFVQIRTIADEKPRTSGPARRRQGGAGRHRQARQRAAGALPKANGG